MLGQHGELNDDDLGLDASRTKALINAVFQEVHRLQRHPELYPTEASARLFVNAVKQIVFSKSNGFQLTRLITDPEIWDALGDALGVNGLFRQLSKTERLTAWEKFLFPGSPGSGLALQASDRLLPPAATKMMALWHFKTAFVARYCGAVSLIAIALDARLLILATDCNIRGYVASSPGKFNRGMRSILAKIR
jgi:hypothetical protein